MKTINHEVFGTIRNSKEDRWERDLKLFIFGRERDVTLKIFSNDDNIEKFTECQVAAYKNFFGNIDQFLRRTEIEVYEYYQSVCEEYRDAIGDEEFLDEIAPIISSKEEVYDLLSQIAIHIPYSYDDTRTIGIGMECTWEDEHGLGVRFEDEEVESVGYYSEIY